MSPIPPITEPFLDGANRVTPAWYTWLEEIRTRMGGDVDLILTATNTAFVPVVNGTDGTTRDGSVALS